MSGRLGIYSQVGNGSVPALPFAFDNALDFDGVNDYVSLMGANSVKSAQPFSMSFWFNADDITSTRLAGFSTDAGRGLFIGLLDLSNYRDLYFICQDGSRNSIRHTFLNNTWYHCVITYNGLGFTTRSNYKCYIDGASKTLYGANSFSAPATEVTIGSQGALFGGSQIQDEWYYWDNYELSATDVTNLYNGGSGDYASVVASTPTFELRFNESGSDTTAADSSGNGNNGTLNNFTYTPSPWVAHPSFDPDAQAYIAAASIVDTTEIAAVNQLFLDLKGTGSTTNNSNIYSKFFAIYPISPTSLAASAVNAVNPSTYDITWFNSPTHSGTGITGNGATQYGDTTFIPATHASSINDFGCTMSVKTATGTNTNIDMAVVSGGNYFQFSIQNGTYNAINGNINSFVSGTSGVTGIWSLSRRSSTDLEKYINGTTAGTDTTLGGTLPAHSIFLLGRNNAGTLDFPSARRYDFFAIHRGLTSNESKDLSDAITTYNTSLSR